MPRPSPDALVRIHIQINKNDLQFLQLHYGASPGVSQTIRAVLHFWIQKVQEELEERPAEAKLRHERNLVAQENLLESGE